jgi:Zn-dependent metalloprotease
MQTTKAFAPRLRTQLLAMSACIAVLAATPAAATATGSANTAQQPAAASHTTAPSPATREATTVPRNVKLYQTRHSQLGLHRWYRQYQGKHPVIGGWWGWHRAKAGGEITIWDGRKSVGKVNADQPAITVDRAADAASKATSARQSDITRKRLMVLPPSATNVGARLVWAISSANGRGARTSYVDAVTGVVLKTINDTKFVHSPGKLRVGHGRVFDPNPVQKLQDESLRDQHDSAQAVPPGGYTNRHLAHLTGQGHTLVGLWVRIVNRNRATSNTATYKYNRSNPFFEQTMAYYAIDTEQSYLQRLGFTDVNAESEKIQTNAFPDDNSFYDSSTDMISMGTGGVDDAEDPEVTWHEYGHAIQADQIPAWGSRYEGRAIGEAFGDYMAVTMSQRFAPDTVVAPTACVMDWDATSYTPGEPHCLRRTDEDKVYPDDLDPGHDPHADGEIWSRALWDINQAIGRNRATTIIVEAQFWMTPRINFKQAARTTVDIAGQLFPGNDTVTGAVTQAFVDRGILPAG